VIASASAVVRPHGVLGGLISQPPLTLRKLHDDDPEVCALGLVGSAAGPLAGDSYDLHLEVLNSARASLQATGASIAQGRGGVSSSVAWSAVVGSFAELLAHPGALIACAGSRVRVSVSLELAETSAVEWHETVVLGRSTDTEPGAVELNWDVRRGGRPLLRQRVDLSDRANDRWFVSGRRVMSSVLLAGPEVLARTIVASPTSVVQRIDEHAVLITVLASDGAEAALEIADLLGRFAPVSSGG
jgi:urease accessory protein